MLAIQQPTVIHHYQHNYNTPSTISYTFKSAMSSSRRSWFGLVSYKLPPTLHQLQSQMLTSKQSKPKTQTAPEPRIQAPPCEKFLLEVQCTNCGHLKGYSSHCAVQRDFVARRQNAFISYNGSTKAPSFGNADNMEVRVLKLALCQFSCRMTVGPLPGQVLEKYMGKSNEAGMDVTKLETVNVRELLDVLAANRIAITWSSGKQEASY